MTYWASWTDPLRHPRLLGWVHRLLHHSGAEACIVCRWVWRRLEADGLFVERMAQAQADIAAGRVVLWDPNALDGDV